MGLIEHVFAVKTRILPEEHPSILVSLHELAHVYLKYRQISKAMCLIKHVVAVQIIILPEEHLSRLKPQH